MSAFFHHFDDFELDRSHLELRHYDSRQTGSNPSRQLLGNRLNWRKIAGALTDSDFGEETEQACAYAWLRQL